jgi:hypothetical protein
MKVGNAANVFLAFAISLILLSQSYTAFGATDKIALNIDRTVYSIGMQVTVVGQVLGSFDPDSPARITVTGPAGYAHKSADVSLDPSGGFTYQFTIVGDVGLVGTNTLKATHSTISGMVSGTLTFEVRQRASITIQTSQDSYQLNDHVALQGKVSPVLPDSQVLIQVFNPKNQAWSFKEVSLNSISPDGQFTVELGKLAGARSVVGTYTVKAFYASSTASVTETFLVGDSDSQSQSGDDEESNQGYQSSAGAPSTIEVVETESDSASAAEVAKETVVQSEIKNANEQPQEFTYIMLVKDSEGITVSLSWAKGMLDPNQSLTMEQSWMPEIPGEYAAEIFVWESLDNPVPLSGKIVKTITVE